MRDRARVYSSNVSRVSLTIKGFGQLRESILKLKKDFNAQSNTKVIT
jgi:hypothetical protein